MKLDQLVGALLILSILLLWPQFIEVAIAIVAIYNGVYAISRRRVVVAGRAGPPRTYFGARAYVAGTVLVVVGVVWLWFGWPQ